MITGQCPTCGRGNTRSLEQNNKMWAMLKDLEGLDWYGQKLKDFEWKDVLTASLNRQKVVPGIDGGFVVIGTSTRRMTLTEMSELIELITAFGVTKGVKFRDGYSGD